MTQPRKTRPPLPVFSNAPPFRPVFVGGAAAGERAKHASTRHPSLHASPSSSLRTLVSFVFGRCCYARVSTFCAPLDPTRARSAPRFALQLFPFFLSFSPRLCPTTVPPGALVQPHVACSRVWRDGLAEKLWRKDRKKNKREERRERGRVVCRGVPVLGGAIVYTQTRVWTTHPSLSSVFCLRGGGRRGGRRFVATPGFSNAQPPHFAACVFPQHAQPLYLHAPPPPPRATWCRFLPDLPPSRAVGVEALPGRRDRLWGGLVPRLLTFLFCTSVLFLSCFPPSPLPHLSLVARSRGNKQSACCPVAGVWLGGQVCGVSGGEDTPFARPVCKHPRPFLSIRSQTKVRESVVSFTTPTQQNRSNQKKKQMMAGSYRPGRSTSQCCCTHQPALAGCPACRRAPRPPPCWPGLPPMPQDLPG